MSIPAFVVTGKVPAQMQRPVLPMPLEDRLFD